MVPFESEEFWDDLLAFIEVGRVIPVVGAELLRIQRGSGSVPLYRAVADELLDRYKSPHLQQEEYGLNEAVYALAGSGRRVRDLYRPIHDILKKLVEEQADALLPLKQLASIRHFDLFVTTTPDDLLARALNSVRFKDSGKTDEIEFAPKLPTERLRDIPEAPSSKYTAVFYMFGKSDMSPFYAIHDEDALEFPYTLQTGCGPERVFSQIRTRNLLLIGCSFAPWLSPFLIRLSNPDRLFSDQRIKKEYLVGQGTVRDRDLVTFLERFSQDSRCCPMEASEFVSQLHARWLERNPTAPPNVEAPAPSGGTIFISYATEDATAAKKLFEELQIIGGDIAWFDRNALRTGDIWEKHILSAIKKCSLFLPLLSRNTEGREEGYFRGEWDEACNRSRKIEGRKFILPIVIDPSYTGDTTSYRLLPEAFKQFQYGHAPNGQMSDALRDAIQVELRSFRRLRSA